MANEKRLIDANAFIKELDNFVVNPPFAHPATPWHRGVTLAAETALRMPTVDAVSRGVHDQVRWERDVAIGQLESYGISLGEKADAVKVVRCKDCKYCIDTSASSTNIACSKGVNWRAVEPYGFCSRGERRDNG